MSWADPGSWHRLCMPLMSSQLLRREEDSQLSLAAIKASTQWKLETECGQQRRTTGGS